MKTIGQFRLVRSCDGKDALLRLRPVDFRLTLAASDQFMWEKQLSELSWDRPDHTLAAVKQ